MSDARTEVGQSTVGPTDTRNTQANTEVRKYIGLTEPSFKSRWQNHKTTFTQETG